MFTYLPLWQIVYVKAFFYVNITVLVFHMISSVLLSFALYISVIHLEHVKHYVFCESVLLFSKVQFYAMLGIFPG